MLPPTVAPVFINFLDPAQPSSPLERQTGPKVLTVSYAGLAKTGLVSLLAKDFKVAPWSCYFIKEENPATLNCIL